MSTASSASSLAFGSRPGLSARVPEVRMPLCLRAGSADAGRLGTCTGRVRVINMEVVQAWFLAFKPKLDCSLKQP